MLGRALFAFLALPGVVAIAVPATWLYLEQRTTPEHVYGLLPLLAGVLALLRCTGDFYVSGRGTLAPWAPPRDLVTVGLYRWTRNPMYVAVLLMLLGWAWAFAHRGLLVYAVCVAIAFELRVVFGEEPWLARTHGEAWHAYAARVPRWFW